MEYCIQLDKIVQYLVFVAKFLKINVKKFHVEILFIVEMVKRRETFGNRRADTSVRADPSAAHDASNRAPVSA